MGGNKMVTKTHIYKVYGEKGKFYGEVGGKDKKDASKKASKKFKQNEKDLLIAY